MKLSAAQLASFLKNPASNCHAVLLYGPEKGLVAERSESIARALVSNLQDPFAVSKLSTQDVKDEPARLHDALSAMSLLGGQRLVLIQDGVDGLTKLLEEAYTSIRQPEAFLIITAGELTPRSSLRRYFEEQKHTAALPCYALEGRDMEQRICDYLRQQNVAFHPQTVQALAHSGSDWATLRQHLETTLLYLADGETLTLEVLEQLQAQDTASTLSRLAHAVADRNAAQVEQLVKSSWSEGAVPITILRSVAYYFHRLAMADAYQQQGISGEALLKKLRPQVFFKEAPMFRKHLAYWSQERLPQALHWLMLAEQKCKRSPAPATAQAICSRCLFALARG